MPLTTAKTKRAPAFFVGHGNPMNVIQNNAFTKSLDDLGRHIEKPKAVLVVSAHWTSPHNAISIHPNDELMYDMYGFPEALYNVKYPAQSAEFLIPDLQKLIPSLHIEERKLDHGVWSVLVHLFPYADIPVLQLAINGTLSMQEHYAMGKRLRELRDNGVMIIGSGNITHNLREVNWADKAPVVPWAKEFDDYVKNAILDKDFDSLVDFERRQSHAKLAHPTSEHFIPLLYIAGSSYDDDESRFIYEGMEHGSLSMRSWLLTQGA